MMSHPLSMFTARDARLTQDRAGLFVEAQGGTIFLDEIGDLPLDLQPKFGRSSWRWDSTWLTAVR